MFQNRPPNAAVRGTVFKIVRNHNNEARKESGVVLATRRSPPYRGRGAFKCGIFLWSRKSSLNVLNIIYILSKVIIAPNPTVL